MEVEDGMDCWKATFSSPFLHGQVIFNIFHPFFISVIVGGRIASGNYIIAIHSISNHES